MAALPFASLDEPLYLVYTINRTLQLRAGALLAQLKAAVLGEGHHHAACMRRRSFPAASGRPRRLERALPCACDPPSSLPVLTGCRLAGREDTRAGEGGAAGAVRGGFEHPLTNPTLNLELLFRTPVA